ncbi:50S ribosomal protein L23 [Patescibacteria group bacterium]|nr:50S ribosomal protein L23 [Patescibacteria group bacterium]
MAELSNKIYRSIQSAHITEKAGDLTERNKYVFRVYPRTNKPEIKKSIEALYGVKVAKVHIVHSAPKKMRLGKREGFKHGLKKGFKKAIVTLKEGSKIELLPR